MPTIRKLGEGYFKRLISSNNRQKEFDKILSEIDRLIDDETGKPILKADKAKIIAEIIERLDIQRKEILQKGDRLYEFMDSTKLFSNDSYLELINYIKSRTKK